MCWKQSRAGRIVANLFIDNIGQNSNRLSWIFVVVLWLRWAFSLFSFTRNDRRQEQSEARIAHRRGALLSAIYLMFDFTVSIFVATLCLILTLFFCWCVQIAGEKSQAGEGRHTRDDREALAQLAEAKQVAPAAAAAATQQCTTTRQRGCDGGRLGQQVQARLLGVSTRVHAIGQRQQ